MIQTDNGSEYIGNVKKKKGNTLFEKVLEEFWIIFCLIL